MSASTVTLRGERRQPVNKGNVVANVVLIIVCAGVILPCLFLVLGSLKQIDEFFSSPFGFPSNPAWSNYAEAWDEGDLGTAFGVSAIATIGAVVLSTILAALISYAISCLRLRWGQVVRVVFVAGLVVPVQLIMLAIFILMRQMHVLGSVWSLVITYTTFGIPLGVLILVGFFQALPKELMEAARMDGAGHVGVFLQVVVPLSRPAITTVAILNGVWIWNDVFVALMLSTSSATQTLPLAILNFFGTYSSEWGLIFASVVISAVPVMIAYTLATRTFMKGLSAGALKE